MRRPFSTFNAIAVLDAVPDGELNSARRLIEDLRDLSEYGGKGFGVQCYRIEVVADLHAAIDALRFQVQDQALKPWLHFAGHGIDDESGIVAADGSVCTWTELNRTITPLNIDLGLNLLFIFATCYGGSFARSIQTTDRAPLLGLIGPTREITAGEIEEDFGRFYKTFFEAGSIQSALAALEENAEKGLYYRTTAEQFFYDVWGGYKMHLCTAEAIAERSHRIKSVLKSQGMKDLPSVEQIGMYLSSQEVPQFDQFRNRYFMYDLYPENIERFSVTHDGAEERLLLYLERKAARDA